MSINNPYFPSLNPFGPYYTRKTLSEKINHLNNNITQLEGNSTKVVAAPNTESQKNSNSCFINRPITKKIKLDANISQTNITAEVAKNFFILNKTQAVNPELLSTLVGNIYTYQYYNIVAKNLEQNRSKIETLGDPSSELSTHLKKQGIDPKHISIYRENYDLKSKICEKSLLTTGQLLLSQYADIYTSVEKEKKSREQELLNKGEEQLIKEYNENTPGFLSQYLEYTKQLHLSSLSRNTSQN